MLVLTITTLRVPAIQRLFQILPKVGFIAPNPVFLREMLHRGFRSNLSCSIDFVLRSVSLDTAVHLMRLRAVADHAADLLRESALTGIREDGDE
ncbi:hypothetical protein ACGFNV_10700 [Streptomyces sp. NPDC048751]|uniref:hypothetical protein n=1 Tax=Streptomyces sp. NPDC048751 TaxID=3365591 RepID=UPI0037234CE0